MSDQFYDCFVKYTGEDIENIGKEAFVEISFIQEQLETLEDQGLIKDLEYAGTIRYQDEHAGIPLKFKLSDEYVANRDSGISGISLSKADRADNWDWESVDEEILENDYEVVEDTERDIRVETSDSELAEKIRTLGPAS